MTFHVIHHADAETAHLLAQILTNQTKIMALLDKITGVAELVKAGKLSPERASLIEFRDPTAREREFAEGLSGKVREAWNRRRHRASGVATARLQIPAA